MPHTRPAAVAGMFYPGDAATLTYSIGQMLEHVHPVDIRPKALIVPHAGYIYSGPVAASAYALLRPLRHIVRRVILLGPVHRVWVQKMALPNATAFETPLGTVNLDEEAMALLGMLPQVEINAAAHAWEHSLEVQIPFLQSVLGDFKLVPLAVGGASAAELAEALETLWGGDETLIVVSSDLSHYLPYDMAREVDQGTVQHILGLRNDLVGEQACGSAPINGLLLVARRKRLAAHLLDMRNSGDTAGDRDKVVGYAAIAFDEEQHVH